MGIKAPLEHVNSMSERLPFLTSFNLPPPPLPPPSPPPPSPLYSGSKKQNWW